MGHHFISYSTVEATDFAIQLHDVLENGDPSLEAWLDKRDLKPGRPWDSQIADGIRDCATLLFAMTPDSVEDTSICYDEWTLALKYKKTVVPLRLDPNVEPPFRLHQREWIDFTTDFDTGAERLREYLLWLNSPEGRLQTLHDRLRDAQRDLRRARDDIESRRIQAEIHQLMQDIRRQQQVVNNPAAAIQHVEDSIERGLELERRPSLETIDLARAHIINLPPSEVPPYFQDREAETAIIGEFLQHPTQRVLTVVGRGGVGKTAIVCRVLKTLEQNELPDDGGTLECDGIVYLSTKGSKRVNVPNLFSGLSKLLPTGVAQELDKLYRDPHTTPEEQFRVLLEYFPKGRFVVLLDNMEDLTDPETQSLTDAELLEALQTFLRAPSHAVKIIMTTRFAPRELMLIQPQHQRRLDLEAGLPSPYGENILRQMDVDGTQGLRDLPPDDPLLQEARRRTRGYPRALEALFGILAADRSTSLQEILNTMEQREGQLLPQNVVGVLVGEAFNRLDMVARQVIQALAIYGRPVPSVAIDYLLQPFEPGLQSESVLRRLVNMHFVSKESQRYSLQPIDQAYALSLIKAVPDRFDNENPFTQQTLYRRAADYFHTVRKDADDIQTIEDLEAYLAEIDLRESAGDYDQAMAVLLEIDFEYLFLWGHYRLMVELYERLLPHIAEDDLKVQCLQNLAEAYDYLAQAQRSLYYYEEALALARAIGARKNEGAILGQMGNAFADLGELDKAGAHYEQALAIARDIGDRRREGVWLGNLGNTTFYRGRLQDAIELYQQALAIAEEVHDQRNACIWLGQLGNAHVDLGQMQQAIEFYKRSLAIDREIGFTIKEAIDLGSLGNAFADLGEAQMAIQHHQQAQAIFHDIGDQINEAHALENIGDAYLDLNQFEDAERYYQQALQIAESTGFSDIQATARRGLAVVYLRRGQADAARQAIEEAQPHARPDMQATLQLLAGIVYLRQAELAAAQEAFRAAITHADELLSYSSQNYSALDSKGLALCGLAIASGDNKLIPQAIRTFQEARSVTRAKGTVRRVVYLYDDMEAPLDAALRQSILGH